MTLGNVISGVTGNVTIPEAALRLHDGAADPQPVNARITRWSMSVSREEHDTTTFEVTDNYRTFVGGMVNFTGRCEGYVDSTHYADLALLETEDMAATSAFVLKASEQGTTDREYTFSALISGVELGIDKGGHSSLAFNFRGSLTDATVDFGITPD